MPKLGHRRLLRDADLPPGQSRTKDGHVRYTAPKELRGKYVHRKIVEDLIAETSYYVQQLLPWPFEVHHADYVKTHNYPSNFIIVSEALHSVMTADRARHANGKFRPKWQAPPTWVLFRDDIPALPETETEVGVEDGRDAACDADAVPF